MGSGFSRLKEASPPMMQEPSENSTSAATSRKPPRVLGNDQFRFSLDTSGIQQDPPSHPVPVQAMTVLDLQPCAVLDPSVALHPRSSSLAVVNSRREPQRRDLAQRRFSVDGSRSTNSDTLLSDGAGDRLRLEKSLALAVHRSFIGSTSTAVSSSGVVSIDAFYHSSVCVPPAQDAFDCCGTVSPLPSNNPLRVEEGAVGHDRSLLSNSDNRADATGWSLSSNQHEHRGGEASTTSRLQLPTFGAATANRMVC